MGILLAFRAQAQTPTASPHPTFGPNDLTLSISRVDNQAFPDVRLEVQVSGYADIIPNGLDQQDFLIREDGVLQSHRLVPIGCTTPVSGNLAVALVIDRSGSMGAELTGSMTPTPGPTTAGTATPTPTPQTKLQAAVSAARVFVNQLSIHDQAAVVAFNDTVNVLTAFTSIKAALNAGLDQFLSLGPSGGTAMFDAAYQAVDITRNQMGNRAVILLTDGANSFSTHTKADVIAFAVANRVPVYTIGLGVGGSQAETDLRDIANGTGGLYVESPTTADLASIYLALLQVLQQGTYMLSYVTTNPVEDGSLRNIQVCVDQACDTTQYIARSACFLDGSSGPDPAPVSLTAFQKAAQGFSTGQTRIRSAGPRGRPLSFMAELYFEHPFDSTVQVSLWDVDLQGKPGNRIASADGGTRLINCEGWQQFRFDTAVPPLDLTSFATYFLVAEWVSGGLAQLSSTAPGTSGAPCYIGTVTGGNTDWTTIGGSGDSIFHVFSCFASPTPTTTPTATPTPTKTPSLTPTSSPTQSPSPTATPSLTPTQSPTAFPTVTFTTLPTSTPSATPSLTPTFTPSPTPTQTPTQAPTHTPTNTPKGTLPPTNTPDPRTPSPTPLPTNTRPPTPTPTEPPLGAGYPRIGVAGLGRTRLDSRTGGTLEAMVVVNDVLVPDPPLAEIYFGGQPTGIQLSGTAIPGGTSLFVLPAQRVDGPLSGGRLTLEFKARTNWGRSSGLWPYLKVE